MIDPWFRAELVCPEDHLDLSVEAGALVCTQGHRYPVVEGVPVMLPWGIRPTQREGEGSLEAAASDPRPPTQAADQDARSGVDPFVQQVIAATGGIMYQSLGGRLKEYPIPQLRIVRATIQGETFLELGCNWGRWCLSAARLGYSPVGIDPNLEAILAARRVARRLGVEARYLVGDARYLPFRSERFAVVFSYSVLQHFSKPDAERAVGEAGRVLAGSGRVVIQVANALGLRSLYHQVRRGFRRPRDFEVRYWTPSELLATFERCVGPANLLADGYLTLNPQASDIELLPSRYRAAIRISEALRRLSRRVPLMVRVADSLFVIATRR